MVLSVEHQDGAERPVPAMLAQLHQVAPAAKVAGDRLERWGKGLTTGRAAGEVPGRVLSLVGSATCVARSEPVNMPSAWRSTTGRERGSSAGALVLLDLPWGRYCCAQQARPHAQHLPPHPAPAPAARPPHPSPPSWATSRLAALGEAVGGCSERVGVVGGDAELGDEGAQFLGAFPPGRALRLALLRPPRGPRSRWLGRAGRLRERQGRHRRRYGLGSVLERLVSAAGPGGNKPDCTARLP
jgi:hypothetical protein